MNSNKLLIFDFPEGYQFGIDLRDWVVGPNFKGIKGIPDGCHYIYYSAKDDSNKTGFFLHLNSGQVVVKKWCRKEEDLMDYEPTREDLQRYAFNEVEIDRFLGKYCMENHRDWWSLSNHISKEVVTALMPDCGRIFSVEQFESPKSATVDRATSTVNLRRDRDGLLELDVRPETVVHFLEVPRHPFPADADPSERTRLMLDQSPALATLLARMSTPLAIVGHLQAAFILQTLGLHLPALEAWLALLGLLCSCVQAVTEHEPLFKALLSVLLVQARLSQDDFADITTQNNRFFDSVRRLVRVVLEEANVTDDLKGRAFGLAAALADKHGWDLQTEPEEDLPVVVETTD